jgi:hypothetical protein
MTRLSGFSMCIAGPAASSRPLGVRPIVALYRLPLLVALMLPCADSRAQCNPVWSSLGSGMGSSGVYAVTTLPNGDLVAGGASRPPVASRPIASRAGTVRLGPPLARG